MASPDCFHTGDHSGQSAVTAVSRCPCDALVAVATQQGSTFPYTGGVSIFNGTTWTHYTPDNSPLTHSQVVHVEFDATAISGPAPTAKCCANHDWASQRSTHANNPLVCQLPHRQLLQLRLQQQRLHQRPRHRHTYVTPTITPTATITPSPTPSSTPTSLRLLLRQQRLQPHQLEDLLHA